MGTVNRQELRRDARMAVQEYEEELAIRRQSIIDEELFEMYEQEERASSLYHGLIRHTKMPVFVDKWLRLEYHAAGVNFTPDYIRARMDECFSQENPARFDISSALEKVALEEI